MNSDPVPPQIAAPAQFVTPDPVSTAESCEDESPKGPWILLQEASRPDSKRDEDPIGEDDPQEWPLLL